jgi:hypothetical protein
MRASEKTIWLLAAGVAGFTLIYRLGFSGPEQPPGPVQAQYTLSEARRLLRNGPAIRARQRAAETSLRELRSHFLRPDGSSPAGLKLLCRVEEIARQSGLEVNAKNPVVFSATELGVALEGGSPAEAIVRFLQRLTRASLRLKVKQLQLHSVPEQKVLNYRIVVSARIAN